MESKLIIPVIPFEGIIAKTELCWIVPILQFYRIHWAEQFEAEIGGEFIMA